MPSPNSRKRPDVEDVVIERQLRSDGRPESRGSEVAHAIVEQLEVELLDAGVDHEVIDVGELADHPHRAAGDRRW